MVNAIMQMFREDNSHNARFATTIFRNLAGTDTKTYSLACGDRGNCQVLPRIVLKYFLVKLSQLLINEDYDQRSFSFGLELEDSDDERSPKKPSMYLYILICDIYVFV